MLDHRQTPPLTPRRRGYQDYLASLGDPCPFLANTVPAIEWWDGG